MIKYSFMSFYFPVPEGILIYWLAFSITSPTLCPLGLTIMECCARTPFIVLDTGSRKSLPLHRMKLYGWRARFLGHLEFWEQFDFSFWVSVSSKVSPAARTGLGTAEAAGEHLHPAQRMGWVS